MKNQNVFFDVAKGVSDKVRYEKIMEETHEKYDLRPYKIHKISSATARKIYAGINSRYEKGQLQAAPTCWYENERRLFIWFAVCYEYVFKVQLLDLTEDVWRKFSKVFHSKDPIFLEFQYRNLIKTKGREKWDAHQDELLRKAVQKQKIGRWNQISKEVFFESRRAVFRTPKQCRERWFNHLDNSKTKSEWTSDEDLKMLHFVLEHGTKWAKMVPELNHKRTQHMIKNRFNSLTSNSFRGKAVSEAQETKRKQLIEELITNAEKVKMDLDEQQPAERIECPVNKEEEMDINILRESADKAKEKDMQKKNSQFIDFENFNKDKGIAGSPFPFFVLEGKSPEILTSPMPSFKGLHTPGNFFFEDAQFQSQCQKWNLSEDENKGMMLSQEYLKLPNSEMSTDYAKLLMQENNLKKHSSIQPQHKFLRMNAQELFIKPSSLEDEYGTQQLKSQRRFSMTEFTKKDDK